MGHEEREPVLTVRMVDDVMAAFDGPWTCPSGFTHDAGDGCRHRMTLAQRAEVEAGARRLHEDMLAWFFDDDGEG